MLSQFDRRFISFYSSIRHPIYSILFCFYFYFSHISGSWTRTALLYLSYANKGLRSLMTRRWKGLGMMGFLGLLGSYSFRRIDYLCLLGY